MFLIQVDYYYNVSKIELHVLNRDDAEINDDLSARIAFMNRSDDKEILDKYSTYINKYWLFLVNSTEVANSLLSRTDYDKKELSINGIIIPKSLNYKMPSNNENEDIPIFIVDDNITDILYPLDIRTMKKNTYFIFDIKRAIANYPEKYLLAIAILCLLTSLAIFVYWRVILKSTRHAYILSYHKFFFFILFHLIF